MADDCPNYTATRWAATSAGPEDDRCVNCGHRRSECPAAAREDAFLAAQPCPACGKTWRNGTCSTTPSRRGLCASEAALHAREATDG